MGKIEFTARLEPRGPAAAVVLDDEQVVIGRDVVTGRGSGGYAAGSSGQDPVR